jgi:tyrosinase
MTVEFQINNSADLRARFITWAPSPCRIRISNPAGATPPSASVRISGNSAGASAGALVFRSGSSGAFSSSLTLTLPVNGTSVSFFVAGEFGRASINDGDVAIEARSGTTLVGSVPVMVRIRKNANRLTAGERDRFIAAFARFNNQGAGRFVDFRNMHTMAGDPEAHRAPGFLPWHRAYLLDLERELQAIDPSVALPYWRFDQAAPNLFTRDFIGVSDALGTVQFSATNAFRFWVTDGVQGINRRPLNSWNPATQGAPTLRTEAQTLALGTQFSGFRAMEGNPHGTAHTRWGGSISSIGTAARDPLFFLLHCNVDRLWAKWQRQNGRFNPAQAASYHGSGSNRIGHNLPDTMWPWNGITTSPRPSTAPGGALASSPVVPAPGPQPRVRDGLDYQGAVNAASRLGFDYDDVRF